MSDHFIPFPVWDHSRQTYLNDEDSSPTTLDSNISLDSPSLLMNDNVKWTLPELAELNISDDLPMSTEMLEKSLSAGNDWQAPLSSYDEPPWSPLENEMAQPLRVTRAHPMYNLEDCQPEDEMFNEFPHPYLGILPKFDDSSLEEALIAADPRQTASLTSLPSLPLSASDYAPDSRVREQMLASLALPVKVQQRATRGRKQRGRAGPSRRTLSPIFCPLLPCKRTFGRGTECERHLRDCHSDPSDLIHCPAANCSHSKARDRYHDLVAHIHRKHASEACALILLVPKTRQQDASNKGRTMKQVRSDTRERQKRLWKSRVETDPNGVHLDGHWGSV